MGTEIERKFLVKPFETTVTDAFQIKAMGKMAIWQGYFAKGEKCSVRLRIEQQGDCEPLATLTFKSTNPGMTRTEVEIKDLGKDVSSDEILQLQGLCEHELRKTRHILQEFNEENGEWETWEIDVFQGDLAGLVIAEIEIPSEDYEFKRPPWLGQEVTHIGDYYNYTLAKNGLPGDKLE